MRSILSCSGPLARAAMRWATICRHVASTTEHVHRTALSKGRPQLWADLQAKRRDFSDFFQKYLEVVLNDRVPYFEMAFDADITRKADGSMICWPTGNHHANPWATAQHLFAEVYEISRADYLVNDTAFDQIVPLLVKNIGRYDVISFVVYRPGHREIPNPSATERMVGGGAMNPDILYDIGSPSSVDNQPDSWWEYASIAAALN